MHKLAARNHGQEGHGDREGGGRVKRTMWAGRNRSQINSGDLISIAEVVRADLYQSESPAGAVLLGSGS
jgi:hypothetical protein